MEDTIYTAEHAAKLYGVAYETIRKWALEFEQHFSLGVNPGKGRRRTFTADDMRILALIAEMKQRGQIFAEIHQELLQGKRGDPPVTKPTDLTAIISEETVKNLVTRNEQLQQKIEALSRQIEEHRQLEIEYAKLQGRFEAETQSRVRLEENIREIQDERVKLYEQIGQLKAHLEQFKPSE